MELLTFYKKCKVESEFFPPSEEYWNDMRLFVYPNSTLSYEDFFHKSKIIYEKSLENGFGMRLYSIHSIPNKPDLINEIKNDEDFIGFTHDINPYGF